MEQMYSASARSLSASGGSEMRSQYVMESGFYISSFVATIFIASLATVALLLISLLISLAMMLQSCQNKNDRVIELQNINNDYSYCKVYSLHAELNNLQGYNLPNICRGMAIQYIEGGQYARDLELTESVIEDYFKSVRPSDDGLEVVLIDIDDIFPRNPRSSNCFQRSHDDSISNCIKEAKNLKLMLVLRLYMNLQGGGWSIILLSRELLTHQNVTINNLVSAGFRGWSSLMMRAEDEDCSKGNECFSRHRNVIERKGFHIKGIISSHTDALTVSDAGMRIFFIPDPICDKFEHQMESIDAGY